MSESKTCAYCGEALDRQGWKNKKKRFCNTRCYAKFRYVGAESDYIEVIEGAKRGRNLAVMAEETGIGIHTIARVVRYVKADLSLIPDEIKQRVIDMRKEKSKLFDIIAATGLRLSVVMQITEASQSVPKQRERIRLPRIDVPSKPILPATSCMFITNDDMLYPVYCGEAVHKRSYCKEHHKLCYIRG